MDEDNEKGIALLNLTDARRANIFDVLGISLSVVLKLNEQQLHQLAKSTLKTLLSFCHPDKFEGDSRKAGAEREFKALNAYSAVLNDIEAFELHRMVFIEKEKSKQKRRQESESQRKQLEVEARNAESKKREDARIRSAKAADEEHFLTIKRHTEILEGHLKISRELRMMLALFWKDVNPDLFPDRFGNYLDAEKTKLKGALPFSDALGAIIAVSRADGEHLYAVVSASISRLALAKAELRFVEMSYSIDGNMVDPIAARGMIDNFDFMEFYKTTEWKRSQRSHPAMKLQIDGVSRSLEADAPVIEGIVACAKSHSFEFSEAVPALYEEGMLLRLPPGASTTENLGQIRGFVRSAEEMESLASVREMTRDYLARERNRLRHKQEKAIEKYKKHRKDSDTLRAFPRVGRK